MSHYVRRSAEPSARGEDSSLRATEFQIRAHASRMARTQTSKHISKILLCARPRTYRKDPLCLLPGGDALRAIIKLSVLSRTARTQRARETRSSKYTRGKRISLDDDGSRNARGEGYSDPRRLFRESEGAARRFARKGKLKSNDVLVPFPRARNKSNPR